MLLAIVANRLRPKQCPNCCGQSSKEHPSRHLCPNRPPTVIKPYFVFSVIASYADDMVDALVALLLVDATCIVVKLGGCRNPTGNWPVVVEFSSEKYKSM